MCESCGVPTEIPRVPGSPEYIGGNTYGLGFAAHTSPSAQRPSLAVQLPSWWFGLVDWSLFSFLGDLAVRVHLLKRSRGSDASNSVDAAFLAEVQAVDRKHRVLSPGVKARAGLWIPLHQFSHLPKEPKNKEKVSSLAHSQNHPPTHPPARLPAHTHTRPHARTHTSCGCQGCKVVSPWNACPISQCSFLMGNHPRGQACASHITAPTGAIA